MRRSTSAGVVLAAGITVALAAAQNPRDQHNPGPESFSSRVLASDLEKCSNFGSVGYVYGYPHKKAYRPLGEPRPLREVWAGEPARALYCYVHVPFCNQRCSFCNLFTYVPGDGSPSRAYLEALAREMSAYREALGRQMNTAMPSPPGAPWSTPEGRERMLNLLAIGIPTSGAMFATVVNLVNLWLGGRIVRLPEPPSAPQRSADRLKVMGGNGIIARMGRALSPRRIAGDTEAGVFVPTGPRERGGGSGAAHAG